jgi:deoxyribodipyrimidine photo-lyase
MNPVKTTLRIFWFRRDLRLHDNVGLLEALRKGESVLPIFIFDRNILDKLEDRDDPRVTFIHRVISDLHAQLSAMGSGLHVFHGFPIDVFRHLLNTYQLSAVHTNHDYEPYARRRDADVASLLQEHGVEFHTHKDVVLFERSEVVKDDGLPYTVFTPYSRKWLAVADRSGMSPVDTSGWMAHFHRFQAPEIPTLEAMGFRRSPMVFPSAIVSDTLISEYAEKRNFPSLPATSRLGLHLRFGTISVRALAQRARALCPTFLNELIWRDFYHMVLWHFPHVGEGKAFKPLYDQIEWRRDPEGFERWCQGQTGYPIVDAGMRELAATGFMHNRVRMITASFLTKHLLIDWRLGEAWFARKLLDFDLAANNGGWQWAAGSGCDAAPYFRVFNPALQTEKFDAKGTYIRKWVPEYGELTYPRPMVEHAFARNRCLQVYGQVLKPGN